MWIFVLGFIVLICLCWYSGQLIYLCWYSGQQIYAAYHACKPLTTKGIPGRVGLDRQRRTGIEQGQASFTPSSPNATTRGGRALHYNMEGGAGSGGQKNINRKVIKNAFILFDVLHDDTIPAEDKLPLMKKVLSGDNVDITFPDEYDGRNTLLHGAVSHRLIDIVKLLLTYDADVDSKNAEGETPLHTAVFHGFEDEVKLLLTSKADVNLKNAEGETPLHMVVSCRRKLRNKVQKSIIQILLGHEAGVNIQNLAGDTLLHLAVRQGEIPVIGTLVGKADADIKNAAGVTPRDLARDKNKVIRYIFDSSFNKLDRAPQDEIYPDQDNNAGVADTINAKDKCQVQQVSDAFTNLTYETSNQETYYILESISNKPVPVPQNEIFPVQVNNAGVLDTSFAKDENQIKQSEDAFADFKDTYAASGAKHSIHGTVYQLCLLMMFALRAFRLSHPFRLGTEADEAEQFDDIVLYQLPQSGKRATLFVQVKHKANSGKGLHLKDLLAKGNNAQFSLLKYFKSFVKIMQTKGQEASEIDFTLCTNTHFEVDELCKLIGDNMTLSLQIVTDVYQEFFKEGKCYKLVTDERTVELLRDYFVTEYTAELSSFNDDKSKQSVDTNINYVKANPDGLKTQGKEVTNMNPKELNELLSSLIDGKSLRVFLNNLTFVVEQPADNELVKTEFRAQSKTNLVDTDLLTDAFYKQIFVWFSNKEGVWLKNETIEQMIGSITGNINTFASSGISRVHAENLLSSPFQFIKDKLIKLNDVMRENRFVNLLTSRESKLTLIQVAQAIEYSKSYVELDSYMFMRVSSLLPCGNQDFTIDAFKSPGKHDLLVIDCLSKTENISQRELTTLVGQLLQILASNPKKKLVIIATENHKMDEMFRSFSGYVSHTVTNTWKDFTNETQDILLATKVYFQGLPVELNQVIDKTETELLEIVPLETLIGDEGLVIGTEFPSALGYNEFFYIDRSVNYVNQIVLKEDIFQDKSKGKLQEELALTEAEFENLCEINSGVNIHLVKKRDKRYVWVKSQGKFKALRPYIDNIDYKSCSEEAFLNSVKLQRLVIISDLAGMGKSTVLTHFAYKMKVISVGTYVFKIDLNNYTKLLENHKSTIFDHSNALDFLYNEIIMIKTPLESALFKRKGKVVLLFDGFDEISPDYAETALGLIQNLTESTVAQIWITTRPFMKEKLEDKLRQWSSSLEPFSEQNQVDYLIKYWKHKKNMKDSDDGRTQIFATSLISQFSKSISDKEREFTGIPLQMKMLAECFVDDIEKSLDFKKLCNLVDLYKIFIDKKFEIYFSEKIENDSSKVGLKHIKNLLFASCNRQHRYLGLSVIISEKKFAFLIPDDNKKINSEEKIMVNKIGIVNLGNETPHFIHRTFAEYWVAEYFNELLKYSTCMRPNVKSFILSELLISDNYAVARSFLNGLLSTGTLSEFQEHLLTQDDLNNMSQVINEIFVRTAIEGNNNMLIYLLNGVEGTDERVLKLLQGNASELLQGKSLLNLAAKNNNFEYTASLLQWTRDNLTGGQDIVKRMLEACSNEGRTPLHAASVEGHNAVVQTLLQWTLDNLTGGQGIVKRLLEARDSKGWTPLHAASVQGHNAVGQTLLQWTRDNLTDPDMVNRMLKIRDSDGWTPLHAATWHGNNEVVQTLLQWTRDNLTGGQVVVKWMLEACNNGGWTPLHLATRQGHNDVVQTLLQWTRDNLTEGQVVVKWMLEACNNGGWTPLHLASEQGHNDVVQALLQWTLDNLTGDQEIVKWMLKTGNNDGRTSLHRASVRGHNAVVQTLLQWTLDNLTGGQEIVKWMLGARDRDGSTPLQYATWRAHNEVVPTILQWTFDNLDQGHDVVKQMLEARDNDGWTPLHEATGVGHNAVVQTLLQWTRDNLTGGQDIVKRMLEACNNGGWTPLHLASERGHNAVMKTLLQWTLDNLT